MHTTKERMNFFILVCFSVEVKIRITNDLRKSKSQIIRNYLITNMIEFDYLNRMLTEPTPRSICMTPMSCILPGRMYTVIL